MLEEVIFNLVRQQNVKEPLITRSETFDSLQSESDAFYTKHSQKSNSTPIVNSKNSQLLQMIRKESADFLNYLKDKDIEKMPSTRSFWLKKANLYPNLTKAAQIVYNIPSSSAFIERFFSICGITCRKNAGNIGASMIINRSMLKANINLLDFNFD